MTIRSGKLSIRMSAEDTGLIPSLLKSDLSPKEILEQLELAGVDSYVTAEGRLLVKAWQLAAEFFVPPESVSQIMEDRAEGMETDALEWVSRNLGHLTQEYPGRWIAVADDRVLCASQDLVHLMEQLREVEVERPFVTQIPAEPIIWDTAYGV